MDSKPNDNEYIYTSQQTDTEIKSNVLENMSTRNGNDNVFVYLRECRNSYEYNFTYEEKLNENFSVYASLSFLNKTSAPLASSEVTLMSASDETVSLHDTHGSYSTQTKKSAKAAKKSPKNSSLNGKKKKNSNGSLKSAKQRQAKV